MSEEKNLLLLKEEIRSANLVLAGLGEGLSGDRSVLYQALSALLKKKDYFIVSLLDDRTDLEAAGLNPEQITLPLAEGETQKSWERYLHWLSFTLNQKLCILELGAGFAHPELIRFPFEKTCYFNRKSRMFRINRQFPQLTEEIAERGVSIQADPAVFLTAESRPEEET